MQQMRRTPARTKTRRDPAPSRIAYRLHRLWLTPLFRKVVRVWMPAALVLGVAIGWIISGDRMQKMSDAMADLRASIEGRPEFMVKLMAIDGASPDLALAIRDVMSVDLPASSFDLDLEDLRQRVSAMDGIKRVDIRIRSGGVLQLAVSERLPAVIWRNGEGLQLLDAGGHRVASVAARSARADLPLIAGVDAQNHVDEALQLISEARPIAARLRGLVRISESRWDIVLDRNQRILLPEHGATAALNRVLALDEAQDLLARDVTHIDMRNSKRPVLRMSQYASDQLGVMKSILVKKDN